MKSILVLNIICFSLNAYSQPTCNPVRPEVNAQLTLVGNLSQSNQDIGVTTVGSKIFFAGGVSGSVSSRVDIYDFSSNSWKLAELSQAREGIATTVLGTKVYFAGGYLGSGTNVSDRIDIYDIASSSWTIAQLPVARTQITAAAAGNKVVFAGGLGSSYSHYDKADIFDVTTNTWSSKTLVGRDDGTTLGMAATVINNTIYITGGMNNNIPYDYVDDEISSTINIYHADSNSWSTSFLTEPKGFLAGIAIDDKNYWAGGITTPSEAYPYNHYTDLVEIRDMNSGASSISCLSQTNGFFLAAKKDTKIVFFTGITSSTNKFDIYDYASNSWAVGILPVRIRYASVISANNTIYVAGGYVDDGPSNKVYKLEFNTPLPLTVIHLSASPIQNQVDVKWQTENALNTASFDIERGADAVHFSSLGSVSAGRNDRRSEYTYHDRLPLKGVNYYRLKMINADGSFSYSRLVAVKMSSSSSLQPFPNPATNKLFIQASGANEKTTLQIIDVAGRKLKEEKLIFSGSTSYAVDITDLPRGVYYLLLTSELKTEQIKFVKL